MDELNTQAPESLNDAQPAEVVQAPVEADKPDTSIKGLLRAEFAKAKEAEAPADGRVRDPATGKYVSKEAAPSAPAQVSDARKDAQPPTASRPEGMPAAWPKEKAALWSNLTPEIQEFVRTREEQASKGFADYGEKVKRYEGIEAAVAEHRPTFQRFGLDDASAVRNALHWASALQGPGKIEAARQLLQMSGIDPSTFARAPQQQGTVDQPEIPEHLRPVLDQFGSIANEVQTLKAERERERNERIQSDLNSFSKDKPHFEKVRVLMGQLMASGAATDLQSAYQTAIYAHPEVRTEVLKEEAAKAEAERKAAAEKAAAQARAASTSISNRNGPTGSVVNGSTPQKGLSVRQTLLNAVKEARA